MESHQLSGRESEGEATEQEVGARQRGAGGVFLLGLLIDSIIHPLATLHYGLNKKEKEFWLHLSLSCGEVGEGE